ncbi:MAG: enoyl-CoA hydratase/isomerase family protein [Novosphingobium sp.]|nr:enoyl-CoA hydratase/isomerase family protein [Novosphingobium sp.]
MYDNYETLKIERAGKILTVTINRPEVKNATNPMMHGELVRIWPEIGRDPDAHVVVFTGAGDSFSAGGDIKAIHGSLPDHEAWVFSILEARDILYGIVDLDRPVIAKVNGNAIGLGASLALFCDLVFARDTAKIADPHVGIGLVAGDGGSVIWPALIGYARAKRYLLTGDAITGAEAAAIGLVTEALPADELDARVQQFAERLANGAGMAIRMTKKSVNMDLRQKLDAMIEAQLGYETMTRYSADHREALEAFLAKRKPSFQGR